MPTRMLRLHVWPNQAAWLNDTGWRDGAPDPCDGHSWFGIYDWLEHQVSACTEPDATTGARSLQVLSLDAAANVAMGGKRGDD